jgi:hypothetical protein
MAEHSHLGLAAHWSRVYALTALPLAHDFAEIDLLHYSQFVPLNLALDFIDLLSHLIDSPLHNQVGFTALVIQFMDPLELLPHPAPFVVILCRQ